MATHTADDGIVTVTRGWLEKAVIGLNLCPFAREVHFHDRIRYAVSRARASAALVRDLMDELRLLAGTAPSVIETTLLIHPFVLEDFYDYNEFLDEADDAVSELGLEGVIQVASFHPQYQFEGTSPGDMENCTNRSPFPMLHLLRESSVARAVTACPDTTEIYRRNIATMRELGEEGWRRLFQSPAKDA